MKYEPVVGLEVHVELQTQSKMFCGCAVVDSTIALPNRYTCPVCTGQPGALPVINNRVIELAVRVGLALNCDIHEISIFARKNYFYPDLPKGYQISQYEFPIATNGWIDIDAKNHKRIGIRRVHIEEDTGKLLHIENYSLIDYNRSGVPLLEIVTEPDLHSAEDTVTFANRLRDILRYLCVNSGDMEKGVIRFEANVSIRNEGSNELNTRTEIKNLNSYRSLSAGIEYEINRQSKIYADGRIVQQETLGFNQTLGTTYSQRDKENAHDYRYFPEPDLPPLRLNRSWIDPIRSLLPELPDAKINRFISDYELKEQEARLLASDKSLADFFEQVTSKSKNSARIVYPWIAGEFMHYVNELGVDLDQIPFTPNNLAKLIDMVADKTISGNAGRVVLAEMFKSSGDPVQIVKENNLLQVSDKTFIQQVVTNILNNNPKEVEQYLAGKENILQWFVGEIARATKGKADPLIARELLVKALENNRREIGN
jgi:aspartyl-tRNA(Asn)/glutamyl-tRNA(Gln) amidotransferase subunit B